MCIESIMFFFNDTATTEIYTLSLHDALPISAPPAPCPAGGADPRGRPPALLGARLRRRLDGRDRRGRRRHQASDLRLDRKSTRLNSSHANISYAVFCLKKKKLFHLHKLLSDT